MRLSCLSLIEITGNADKEVEQEGLASLDSLGLCKEVVLEMNMKFIELRECGENLC
jgi:hypothetical protein